MDGNGDDPFDSLSKLCILSDSQEEILRHCSFAGDPESLHIAPQIPHLKPTEILEQREEITSRHAHQAPPGQSGGQMPMEVDYPSLQDAAAAAIEGGCLRDVSTRVDLGKDNEVGFRLEVQSTEQTAEVEIIDVRRSKVSESDADGVVESASKRLKLSNEALGTSSSVPMVVGKVPIDLETGRESKLIKESVPVGEESGKIDDGKVSNDEETHCNKNKEKFKGKTVENSQPEGPSNLEEALIRDPWKRVLPSTINESKKKAEENSKERDENDATPSGDSGTPTSIIMEVLKILAKEDREEDKKLANMSLLEIATSRGMTFPRPCWWPEGQDFSFTKKS